MEISDGESSRGAGHPCPALLKLQGNKNKTAATGQDLHTIQASPEEMAAIERMLAQARDEKSGRRSCLFAGLKLAGVIFLFMAVGGGLVCGLSHHPLLCAHRSCNKTPPDHIGRHSNPGRRKSKSVPDGTTDGNQYADFGDRRPGCVLRPEICLHRQENGRCQRSDEPCRLAEFSIADWQLPIGEISGQTKEILAELRRRRDFIDGQIREHQKVLGFHSPAGDEKYRSTTIFYHSIGNFHYLTGMV